MKIVNKTRFALSILLLCTILGFLYMQVSSKVVSHNSNYQIYIVQPDDSYWSIAEKLNTGRDVREVIFQLRELNGISPGYLNPGQTIKIPFRGGDY